MSGFDIQPIFDTDACERCIQECDAFIRSAYNRENAVARRSYVFEFGSPHEAFAFAIQYPGSAATDGLPGFTIDELPPSLREATRRACEKMGLERGRVFMNVGRYSAQSGPIPAHYDGELFDYTVVPGAGMEVRRGIRPGQVSILTLRNDSSVEGITLTPEQEPPRLVEVAVGELLRFDNIRYQHSVPDIIEPRPGAEPPRDSKVLRYIVGWRPFEEGCFRWSDGRPLEALAVEEAASMHHDFLQDIWPSQIEADLARASFSRDPDAARRA